MLFFGSSRLVLLCAGDSVGYLGSLLAFRYFGGCMGCLDCLRAVR